MLIDMNTMTSWLLRVVISYDLLPNPDRNMKMYVKEPMTVSILARQHGREIHQRKLEQAKHQCWRKWSISLKEIHNKSDTEAIFSTIF